MDEEVIKTAMKVLKAIEFTTGALSIASIVIPDAVPFVDEALLMAAYLQVYNAKKLLSENEIDDILKMSGLSVFLVNQSLNISNKIIEKNLSKNK